MGLESVSFPDDLVITNPIAGDPRSEGDDHLRNIKVSIKAAFPGLAARAWRSQTKSSGYTVVATDNMTFLNCTAGLTLAITAAATLANGHMFLIHANGGDVIVDPNASELVNGVTTITVPNGTAALIACDGSAFKAFLFYLGVVPVATISGNTTLTAANTDTLQNVTATADVTLPAASTMSTGQSIRFKSSTTGKVRILPAGSDTLDSDSEYLLPAYCNCEVMRSGAGAFILSTKPDYEIGMLYPNMIPGKTPKRGFLFPDGTAQSRTTYAGLYAASTLTGTVTVTLASPGVFTWTSNKLQNNDPVELSTTGALPTGLSSATTYYVVSNGVDGTDKFRLSATVGGSAINTSVSQSGVHTALSIPYGRGDGSTTFNVLDIRGRMPAGRDALGGTAASRITSGGTGINGDTPGATGGAETVTPTIATTAAHDHTQGLLLGGSSQNASGAPNFVSNQNVGSTGGGTAINKMNPVQITSWVIKL